LNRKWAADAIDQLDQFASSLPVVGQSIGDVLDFGGKIRDEIVTPIQDYLAANDPTSSTALVGAVNSVLDLAGSPIDLVDESSGSIFKVRVTNFSFSETEQDLSIDFGAAAEALGLQLDVHLDFTPKVDFGIAGGTGIAFGMDLDPSLSPAEAFFIDLTGTSLGFIEIGHRTSNGWFTDATYNSASISGGSDYALGITLKGSTISVTLDDQLVVSHAFNALVTDGNFGLLSRVGTTSFDSLTVQTDDPNV
jgi:hypothetical protein